MSATASLSRPNFDPLPSRRHPGIVVAVAGAHLALLWWLSQSDQLRMVLKESVPLMVALVQIETTALPPTPALPKAPAATQPIAPRLEIPVVIIATPVPSAEPAPVAMPTLAAAVAPVDLARTPVPAFPAAIVSPAPPLPPAPKILPASAVRYIVQPAIEVPLASRRLGEAGLVLLRVLVDVHGLPRQVALHKSSGFARLDEQALAAMRQARFQPQTENGSAVEWLVIAPLQYDID